MSACYRCPSTLKNLASEIAKKIFSMNDFMNLEKTIVRELSCRMCLCTDVEQLKPLSNEVKRKIKRLFDIKVRADDSCPKAICHECLQQVSSMYLYFVKVEKTQKFLDFHKMKGSHDLKLSTVPEAAKPPLPVAQSANNVKEPAEKKQTILKHKQPPAETQQGDTTKSKTKPKKKSPSEWKLLEALSMDEFAKNERVDKSLLENTEPLKEKKSVAKKEKVKEPAPAEGSEPSHVLDPIVLVDGKPAKQGAELDQQISLFYSMKCCICSEAGFNFRSLMRHYKERHGVPGYVACCDKKFHYFYPKKIIEHMAYHLQPNIFRCPSCHQNFQSSQALFEHQSNGGSSEGKILCPRCSERFPTYHELGLHIHSHRDGDNKAQCDYCGKLLKHSRRKRTINNMEELILCTLCTRSLKNIEKHEKELKEKNKCANNDPSIQQRYQKLRDSIQIDDDSSTVS